MPQQMAFTSDPALDAAYFSTAPDVAEGDSVRRQVIDIEGDGDGDGDGELTLDWDRDGRSLGVEILGTSTYAVAQHLHVHAGCGTRGVAPARLWSVGRLAD